MTNPSCRTKSSKILSHARILVLALALFPTALFRILPLITAGYNRMYVHINKIKMSPSEKKAEFYSCGCSHNNFLSPRLSKTCCQLEAYGSHEIE